MPGRLSQIDRLDRLRVGTPTAVAEGDASVSGNLTISGASTLTGNVTLSGTLTVAGATTLQGAATLQGAVSAEAAFSFGAGVLVGGNPTARAEFVGVTRDVDARAKATGRGTIAFPGTVAISNEAMLKIFSGETAYWVPAFSGLYSSGA